MSMIALVLVRSDTVVPTPQFSCRCLHSSLYNHPGLGGIGGDTTLNEARTIMAPQTMSSPAEFPSLRFTLPWSWLRFSDGTYCRTNGRAYSPLQILISYIIAIVLAHLCDRPGFGAISREGRYQFRPTLTAVSIPGHFASLRLIYFLSTVTGPDALHNFSDRPTRTHDEHVADDDLEPSAL